jgi:Spy/CpxP family protein refolding chaperone
MRTDKENDTMNTTHTRCGRTRSRFGKWLINHKLRKLQLDDRQKQQLDTVFNIAHSAHRDKRMTRCAMQQRISDVMTEQGFDRDRAIDLIRTTSEQEAERAEEVVQAFGYLYDTLTPQQQEQALAMWEKRHRCCRH